MRLDSCRHYCLGRGTPRRSGPIERLGPRREQAPVTRRCARASSLPSRSNLGTLAIPDRLTPKQALTPARSTRRRDRCSRAKAVESYPYGPYGKCACRPRSRTRRNPAQGGTGTGPRRPAVVTDKASADGRLPGVRRRRTAVLSLMADAGPLRQPGVPGVCLHFDAQTPGRNRGPSAVISRLAPYVGRHLLRSGVVTVVGVRNEPQGSPL